ncbi:MAG: FAD:protein FMN transferase [Phycisphaerae bacterium]|nr:FAD:protein FMN transferase [Phycisphaerae bacterium]
MMSLVIIVLVLCTNCFAGNSTTAESPANATCIIETRTIMMGTEVKIKIDTDQSRNKVAIDALRRATLKMNSVVNAVSSWDPNSDTTKVNDNAGIKPVKINKELMAVLLEAKEISRLSDNAFDITFSPIAKLWKQAKEKNTLPTDGQIAETLKLIGSDNLILDAKAETAFLKYKGMMLDLGGIAKGSVIDAAIESLKADGFDNVLVNAGGDLYGMCPISGEPWQIEVTNPKNPKGPAIGTLTIRNMAVVTSGDYEKYIEIDGKRYNHIIDPRTGKSANQCISVTVIAKKTSTADALATAFFILGPQKAIALCEKLPDTETAIIGIKGPVYYSSGFPIKFKIKN